MEDPNKPETATGGWLIADVDQTKVHAEINDKVRPTESIERAETPGSSAPAQAEPGTTTLEQTGPTESLAESTDSRTRAETREARRTDISDDIEKDINIDVNISNNESSTIQYTTSIVINYYNDELATGSDDTSLRKYMTRLPIDLIKRLEDLSAATGSDRDALAEKAYESLLEQEAQEKSE